jgi:hypothetical protein
MKTVKNLSFWKPRLSNKNSTPWRLGRCIWGSGHLNAPGIIKDWSWWVSQALPGGMIRTIAFGWTARFFETLSAHKENCLSHYTFPPSDTENVRSKRYLIIFMGFAFPWFQFLKKIPCSCSCSSWQLHK